MLKLHFSISVLCFLTFVGFRAVFKDKIKENEYLQENGKKKISSWLFFMVPVLNIFLVITLFLMIGIRKDELEEKSQQAEPYVEKDTECDKCTYRSKCDADGFLFELTRLCDTRRHFVRTRDAICRKETE